MEWPRKNKVLNTFLKVHSNWHIFVNRPASKGHNHLLHWRHIFVFSRCLNGTFSLRKTQKRSFVFVTLLILVNVPMSTEQLFNSKKCSIKAPTKGRNSVYVLMEICHLRSKWLCPYSVCLHFIICLHFSGSGWSLETSRWQQ